MIHLERLSHAISVSFYFAEQLGAQQTVGEDAYVAISSCLQTPAIDYLPDGIEDSKTTSRQMRGTAILHWPLSSFSLKIFKDCEGLGVVRTSALAWVVCSLAAPGMSTRRWRCYECHCFMCTSLS